MKKKGCACMPGVERALHRPDTPGDRAVREHMARERQAPAPPHHPQIAALLARLDDLRARFL
jgi:hypothetical protein